MSIYYIRKSGSDANNGTSPSTAWLTLTKALSSSGIASGDILYIGAGIYRETVSVGMTSATVETKIIGDIEGRYTNDPGEVIISPYLINDESLPSNSNATLALLNNDYLTFENIYFIGSANSPPCISTGSGGTTNIKFKNCTFLNPVSLTSGHCITCTVPFGISANWEIDNCIFITTANSGYGISFTLATGTGSDYDANIKINNCLFLCLNGIQVSSSGTSSQEGGNVIINNCTFFTGNNSVTVPTTRLGGSNFTYPVKLYNSLLFNRNNTACLNSSELGNFIEDYNIIICNVPRTNVQIGPNTISNGSIVPYLYLGQEQKYLGFFKRFASPMRFSPLIGAGNRTITNLTDINNLSRPKGNPNFLFSGYVTSSTNTSLVDNTKIFPSGQLVGCTTQIVDGLGKGQTKTINENHTGQFFVDGNWLTNPDTTSKYYVYNGLISSSGPVSSATNNTLIDSNAKWGLEFWRGYTCLITSGVSSGNSIMVSGNDQTTLTGFMNWVANPDSTSAYELSWGSGISNSGINYLHTVCGYSEVYDTAQIQSGNTISGTSAIQLFGSASHDFNIPVTGGSNNISVMGYYDSLYSGVKPQLLITNCGNVGIDETSGIMTVGPNTWEQISVNIVPSGNGVVTARLLANSTGAMGISYFDSFSIS